jgi:hypothetical protein
MMVWLQRQEAVDQFQAYLDWFWQGSFQPSTAQQSFLVMRDPRTTEPEDQDGNEGDRDEHGTDDEVFEMPDKSVISLYRIAKHHPPALRHVSTSNIITTHNTARFLDAVHSYVAGCGGHIVPQAHNVFGLWKCIKFCLSHIPQASDAKTKNIVRASPAVPPSRWRLRELSHFDFALVQTGKYNHKTVGMPLQGMWPPCMFYCSILTCLQGCGLLMSMSSSSYLNYIVSKLLIPSPILNGLRHLVLRLILFWSVFHHMFNSTAPPLRQNH